MDIIRFSIPEQVMWAARLYAQDTLKRMEGSPVLFLVSGGSAFGLLDGLRVAPGEWLTLGVLDERLSRDPAVSNLLQFERTNFFRQAVADGARTVGTVPEETDTVETLADRWEMALREWRAANPDGRVFVTAGMGPDGHTAGIFPLPENPQVWTERFSGDRWVVGYDVVDRHPYPLRVTVTATFLRMQVDAACLYIVGREKRLAFDRLSAEKGLEAETPARVIGDMREARVFTDIIA